jgi:hypothetical protein
MRAVGEKAFEPRFGFGHRVGPRHAYGVEAVGARLFDERGFNLKRLFQKSRLA